MSGCPLEENLSAEFLEQLLQKKPRRIEGSAPGYKNFHENSRPLYIDIIEYCSTDIIQQIPVNTSAKNVHFN